MAKAKKPGRPTKWSDEMSEQVYNYTLLGATDEQLAEFLGVDVATIYRWADPDCDQFRQEFCDARRKGKELADIQVTKSLYRRALGYEQPTEKIMTRAVGGGESVIERLDTFTHVPGDVTAAIFWLKNRRPDQWRDKKALELEDGEGEPLAWPIVRLYTPPPEGEDK
jgi:hypothetical protein